MNADALGFDLMALAAPNSFQDLLALAMEAREEMGRINGLLDAMFEEIDCCID